MNDALEVQDRNGSTVWLQGEFTVGTTIVWQRQFGHGPRVSLCCAQLLAAATKLNLTEPVLERVKRLAVELAVAEAPGDEVEVTFHHLRRAAEVVALGG